MDYKFNREAIQKALDEKGVNRPCVRCGEGRKFLFDGFSRYNLFDSLGDNINDEGSVPIVLVACANCGAITPHAAYALISKEEMEGGDNGE
ncbi:hypothetical protein [Marinifilum sp. D737]|uniref:hypothetical protein n=1 Tax=Marinifilum sp. D737 TaxID=2969628 RepID=UPI002273B12F|nr:hypothetical protein [Marinifilum sp. D737]MCY1634391.1 hypothetical protein [Marinifilum sp. D737]